MGERIDSSKMSLSPSNCWPCLIAASMIMGVGMGGSQISSGSSGREIKKISTRSSLFFYALFYSMAIVRMRYRLICASVNLSPFNGHDWFSRRAIAEINNELVRF